MSQSYNYDAFGNIKAISGSPGRNTPTDPADGVRQLSLLCDLPSIDDEPEHHYAASATATAMRALAAFFQFSVGLGYGWTVLIWVIWRPNIWVGVFFTSVALLAGPLLLITGAILTLFRRTSRAGSSLALSGSVHATLFAGAVIVAVVRDQLVRAPDRGMIAITCVMALVALASDVVGYVTYRASHGTAINRRA